MNSITRLRKSYTKRYLANTRHFLAALAPSIGPLRPNGWYAARLGSGFAAAVPLTASTHLIIGVAL